MLKLGTINQFLVLDLEADRKVDAGYFGSGMREKLAPQFLEDGFAASWCSPFNTE